jgi:hypothetical protein
MVSRSAQCRSSSSSTRPRPPPGGRATPGVGEQATLADARFPGNHEQAATASLRRDQALLDPRQLLVAADRHGRARQNQPG